MAAAARTASDTAVPATKRAEVRCPRLDRSAMARSDLLSESAINRALSMRRLILTGWNCQRRSLALQYLYHKEWPHRVTRITRNGVRLPLGTAHYQALSLIILTSHMTSL